MFPAKIALYVDWLLLTQERQDLIEPIAWAIKRIVAAGVGMRLYVRTYRTYRFDLPISHGGAIGTFYKYLPIGKDRELIWDMAVAHGGSVATDFSYTPIGEDRTARTGFSVGHAAVQQAAISASPVGKDKAFHKPVSVAHSSLLPPDRKSVV